MIRATSMMLTIPTLTMSSPAGRLSAQVAPNPRRASVLLLLLLLRVLRNINVVGHKLSGKMNGYHSTTSLHTTPTPTPNRNEEGTNAENPNRKR